MLLPSSLSSEGLSLRGAFHFFLGLSVRLRLATDPRSEGGGPIFGLAVGVGLAGDLDLDAVDVVDVDSFGAVLAVGWGFAVGFPMEADLLFMNPASVGWCSADD